MGCILGIGGGTRGDATTTEVAVVATAGEAFEEDEEETVGLVSILRTGAMGRTRGGVTDFEGGGFGLLKNVGGGVGVGVGVGAGKEKRDAPLALDSARAVGAAMDGGGGGKLGIADVVAAASKVKVLGVPLVVVVGKEKG